VDYSNFSAFGANAPTVSAASKKWWLAKKSDIPAAITATCKTLQEADSPRQTQYQIDTRLFANINMIGLNGLSFTKVSSIASSIKDRVTYNVCQSVIDTIVAKMSKNRPKPLFLTSGGDYKLVRKAKKLTKFCDGIFYENDAYKLGPDILRDAEIYGDGIVHIFEQDGRVKWERVIATELVVDTIESMYGNPRQLHRIKALDRGTVLDAFPNKKKIIEIANSTSGDLTGMYLNVADLITVTESFHLPSGPDAKDGMHCITLENGDLLIEEWNKPYFPFVFIKSSKRPFGFWGQSVVERLQSIQLEINKILWVIQRSMHLHGTYRVWIKTGSKLPKEHINNDIGTVLVSDEMPQYISSSFIPQEYFSHLNTLKEQAYNQEGISQLSATSKKPAGLDSGKALREYNDIESDRFTVLGQHYEDFFMDCAKLSIAVAKEIHEEKGEYKVQAPGKRFTETIDWADIDLEEDEYIMKCFPVSSLPDDPAGRLQTIQEYMQAGILSIRQGRRLLDFPDLEAEETLDTAREEYLHTVLEKITDEGVYTVPEPEDDLQLANELTLEYYAVGKNQGLEDDRLELLRRFRDQVGVLIMKATPPPPTAIPAGNPPQAVPNAPPVSNMLPTMPQSA
jgi:hypothetical protein